MIPGYDRPSVNRQVPSSSLGAGASFPVPELRVLFTREGPRAHRSGVVVLACVDRGSLRLRKDRDEGAGELRLELGADAPVHLGFPWQARIPELRSVDLTLRCQ